MSMFTIDKAGWSKALIIFPLSVSCKMVFRQVDEKVEKIIWLIFSALLLVIPFSFALNIGSNQLNIPAEPLIAVLALFFLYAIDFHSLRTSKFLKHPITLAGLAYQGWMTCMIPFSSDMLVSSKYVLINAAHFWVFYFGFYYFVKILDKNAFTWVRYYSISFVMVIIYSLVHHGYFHFRMDAAPILSHPFYNDHTLFSAVATFLLPFFLIKIKRKGNWSYINLFIVGLLFEAIFFSYCRAAWLSGIVAIIFALLLKTFKSKYVVLSASLLAFAIVFAMFFPLISSQTQQKFVESKKNSWIDQLRSITDFKSNVSNLERINRYRCAYRMWKDRPLTGFGPGTFQVAFLPYQRPEEMTRISVTTTRAIDGSPHPTGRGGGAHSEYFQALAELGIPGLLAWLGLIGISLYFGISLYYRSASKGQPVILALLAALVTCFSHGLINNFLHSEKISVLFWASLSLMVFLDLESGHKSKNRIS